LDPVDFSIFQEICRWGQPASQPANSGPPFLKFSSAERLQILIYIFEFIIKIVQIPIRYSHAFADDGRQRAKIDQNEERF